MVPTPLYPILFAAHRRVSHLLPDVRGQHGAWGLLHKLLVPPLDRAVPLPQVDAVAVLVAQDLKLDVTRVLCVRKT